MIWPTEMTATASRRWEPGDPLHPRPRTQLETRIRPMAEILPAPPPPLPFSMTSWEPCTHHCPPCDVLWANGHPHDHQPRHPSPCWLCATPTPPTLNKTKDHQ